MQRARESCTFDAEAREPGWSQLHLLLPLAHVYGSCFSHLLGRINHSSMLLLFRCTSPAGVLTPGTCLMQSIGPGTVVLSEQGDLDRRAAC